MAAKRKAAVAAPVAPAGERPTLSGVHLAAVEMMRRRKPDARGASALAILEAARVMAPHAVSLWASCCGSLLRVGGSHSDLSLCVDYAIAGRLLIGGDCTRPITAETGQRAADILAAAVELAQGQRRAVAA